MRKTGVYVRVSTVGQTEASQRHEINRWLSGHGIDPSSVVWFVDKKSGDTLQRPAFEQLQKAVFAGEVDTIVVYKLDRISRSLADGINTLVAWCKAGIRVVSVTQQLDFSGAVGQLVAAVLFAVAEMEQETRRERQAAGIAAAKAAGKKWGGGVAGKRVKVTDQQIQLARRLRDEGQSITAIAKALSLSRPSIYGMLAAPAEVS